MGEPLTMPHITRIQTSAGIRSGIEVDFEIAKEDWNDYRLADGGRVRLKLSACKIYRILDDKGKPARDVRGDPAFHVTYNVLIAGSE